MNVVLFIFIFYLFWNSIGALCVGSKATLSTGKYSELIFTAGGGDGRVVSGPLPALSLPVVGAVVVGGAGQATPLVKQQTVAAGLQGQGSIGALVELVAVVLLGIQLQTFSLGTSNECR